MSLTDDLYREIILEHFRNPQNHGVLESPSLKAEGANPFCGDELQITIALQGEVIQEIRALGKGCSISQASSSMMTEVVKGKTLSQAEDLAKQFKGMMLSNAPMTFTPELEDLESLEGVKKYPVRIKCATLSWNTLLEGIEAHRKGLHKATHVEGEEGARPGLAQQMEETTPSGFKAPTNNLEEQVRSTLKGVIDPELNMNVVDLGLIYGIDIQEGHVRVVYTLTSPGCPLGPVIKGQMSSVLGQLPWVKEIQPELVWNPPWDPRTMASEEAKTELGIW